MNLSDYIDSIDYSYVKTYSGLRGKTYEALIEHVGELRRLKREGNVFEKSNATKELDELSEELDLYGDVKIVDMQENLYKYASEVNTIQRIEGQILISSLRYKGEEMMHARCFPIYRDAIAFFSDSNKIVAIIYICFGCYKIIDHNNKVYPFDLPSYERLKQLLISIGHPIQNDEPFL